MVYARKVGQRELTFIVSGKLWRNSLIMQDVETGSLWSHVTGEALAGELAGERLETIPAVQTTWAKWKAAHPDTLVLAKSRPVKGSRYADYFADPNRLGILRTQLQLKKYPGKKLVHGIHRGGHAVAVADETLKPARPVEVALGEERIVLVRTSDGGVRAWRARTGERVLHFDRRRGRIVDRETESSWDLDAGRATAGPLAGTELEEVVVRPAFWFAWISFFPDSELIR